MKHFSVGILLHIGWLAVCLCPIPFLVFQKQWVAAGCLGVLASMAVYQLYLYATNVNRKLARFFESVQYSDFAIKFRADNTLGNSFSEINQEFNKVLEAFRQTRAEKEANLQYLNTIVQQISTFHRVREELRIAATDHTGRLFNGLQEYKLPRLPLQKSVIREALKQILVASQVNQRLLVGQKNSSKLKKGRHTQTVKLSPQPHSAETLGLRNCRPSFKPSRTKSSSVPSR